VPRRRNLGKNTRVQCLFFGSACFSWPQCAAFTRRYASSVGDHTNQQLGWGGARSGAEGPKRLPGARAAYDIKDLTTDTLGKAMEKYNAYVLKLQLVSGIKKAAIRRPELIS